MTRRRAALGVFLLFQGLYALTASGRVSRVADEFEVYCQVESLWERGTQAIDQVPAPMFFGRRGQGGHRYAPYGPATAFLVLPHHALGRAVAAVVGLAPGPGAPDPWREVVTAVTSLATSTWAALCVTATLLAATSLGASLRRALLVALLLGTSTFLWPYATVFYSEPITAALLIIAVALQLEGLVVAAAVALALALLVKSTNLILAPALALLPAARALAPGEPSSADALRRALRAAAPVLVAAAVATFVHSEWNAHRFGDARELGYDWTEQLREGEAPVAFLLAEAHLGLFGLLLSPGKSILLFAPPLLLALARWPALLRRERGVALAAAGAGVTALGFYASYFYWEGGYCFGPRHLLPVVPLLLLPLAVGPSPRAASIIICLAIGVPLQLLGAKVSFLEDQALGEDGRNQRYYEIDETVPRGRPLNRYVMTYSPLATYPRLLARHLRDDRVVAYGDGLEGSALHLERVRALTHGGLPRWLVLLVPAVGVAFVAAGLKTLRSLPNG
jgi:hypothetical protein